MEVLAEVEPEMEVANQDEEDEEEEEEGEDEGLRDLQELEEMLARVHVAPPDPTLLECNPGLDRQKWPASYRENSAQEKLLLAMAENFRRQYSHLYPDRKPLFLCPENECGVQKFVSTTLRPTLLPHPELYHWQGCASIVSDLLSLELLDPPTDLPKQLHSPTWVLKTQRGTSFDFSTLLCSLLLGAGYDAYCVSGYAVKDICLLNQSHQECPLLKPMVKEETAEQKWEVRKYSVKAPRDLRSAFKLQQEELRQAESRAAQLSKQQGALLLQQEEIEEPKVFEMPPSWVMKLHISQEDMESRFPGGTKLVRYRKATLELFAPYLLRDGLVRRLTTYDDLDCTKANTVTEWYKHRHDHLEQRELKKAAHTTVEQFGPGRSDALKIHRYVTLLSETELQMDFYSHARDDGLARRVETPYETTETFEDRPDFLYYRHTVFSQPGEPTDQRQIQKVEERFHRNRSKPAGQDIAEREFLLSQDQIQVTYHLEENRIIPAWKIFTKPQSAGYSRIPPAFTPQMVSTFQVDPSKKPCKNLHLYETLVALMKEEKDVLIRIKKAEEEVRAILASREKEESRLVLQISIYNTARNEKARRHREALERMAEEARLLREKKELDVLAPFLARRGKPESLRPQEALQMRADCLADLKQRLIDRANLIQSHFEKETEELEQKQLWYQKNQATMTKEDEDSYLAYCSDAMFKIHVLKLRLSQHKSQAPQRYLALAERLSQDPRLAPHLT
ncbi:dynein regulatory complex subunit 7 isoform X2 [Brachyhypopomus gauderio]|uniref:dynein regulatory complex subunit 7 isoform X2 n=1 Tax=Brachyhypopomus gauderio TaxID=698409 RepID=UPI00404245D7